MNEITRMHASNQLKAGFQSRTNSPSLTYDNISPTPPASRRTRRRRRGNKSSRAERIKDKHRKQQRAKRIKILVKDYDLSDDQLKLMKMMNQKVKKKHRKRQRNNARTPRRPQSPQMTREEMEDLTKMPWSSNTKPFIVAPDKSPASVNLNPALSGKRRPLRITSSMDLLAALTNSEAIIMKSRAAVEQHAAVSRLNQGLWGTSGGISSVPEWQGRRSPSRPTSSNMSRTETPRGRSPLTTPSQLPKLAPVRPSSPVMTLQDTTLRDAGVSPTLSRYLNYRVATSKSPTELMLGNPETNPNNLLVYAERANVEQSELARRLYHELMLYELEARRPHNERRVRSRNAAQKAAEEAHRDFLDAAAELEMEKLKQSMNQPYKRQLSSEEMEHNSRVKYRQKARLAAEQAKKEQATNEQATNEQAKKKSTSPNKLIRHEERHEKQLPEKKVKKKKKKDAKKKTKTKKIKSKTKTKKKITKNKNEKKKNQSSHGEKTRAMMKELKALRYEVEITKDHNRNELEASALVIQTRLRGHVARKKMEVERIKKMREDLELKNAALKIQAIQRGRKARRGTSSDKNVLQKKAEDKQLEVASIRIQKIMRGRKARQKMEVERIKKMREDVELKNAALKIQAIQRGRKARRGTSSDKNVLQKKTEDKQLEIASIRIQKIMRGRKARQQLHEDMELERAARRIQAIERGRRARSVAEQAKKNKGLKRRSSLKVMEEERALNLSLTGKTNAHRQPLSTVSSSLSSIDDDGDEISEIQSRKRSISRREKGINKNAGIEEERLRRELLDLQDHHKHKERLSMDLRDLSRNQDANKEEDRLRQELIDLQHQHVQEELLTEELKKTVAQQLIEDDDWEDPLEGFDLDDLELDRIVESVRQEMEAEKVRGNVSFDFSFFFPLLTYFSLFLQEKEGSTT